MPKIDMIKNRNIMTLNSPGIDLRSELISVFIFSILLTERSGLRILKVLRTLRLENWLSSGNSSKSRTEHKTTKKSSLFHGSLR